MTEEEKARWYKLKDECAADLRALRGEATGGKYRKALAGTDARLEAYALELTDNPDAHNLYELLGLRRFYSLFDRYEWRASRVRRFFDFYETLRFSGVNGRQRYKLTPVQAFQFASIFGMARHDGRRLTRLVYIFVPRKFSKTTGAAALAVFDLLFGDHNAQAYVGANSYEQARICFDEIRAIMRDLDPRARHFRVNREKITFRNGERQSLARCLTANARTQDGLSASLVILDEYAQARDTDSRSGAELKNVLTSSMGVRREPLTIIITTASDVVDGPFYRELEGAKRVLRGEAQADTMFASLFMPDPDDREDDPRTWAKVQPHLGVTIQTDYYANEWEAAQFSADNLLTFRTKQLNIFTTGDRDAWLPDSVCRDMMQGFDIEAVKGRPPCAVAFDLSVRDDFSAVSYTIYDAERRHFFSHTDFYFPLGALKGHPNERLYRLWAADGYLKLLPGNVIDVRHIAGDILGRAAKLNVIRIGYDAYKAQDLTAILRSAPGGDTTLQPYSQTNGNFNLPVESLEMMACSNPRRITLAKNPVMLFCFRNCVIDEDGLENKKPAKASQFRKIDGVITLLMTIGLLNDYVR